MTVTRDHRFRPTLILLPRSDVTPDASPAAPPPEWLAAPMKFTPHDDYGDCDDTRDLDDIAGGVLLRAGAWCMRNNTRGFIRAERLKTLTPNWEHAAKILVDAGIWREVAGGYQFVNWRGRWTETAPHVIPAAAPTSAPSPRRRTVTADAVRQALRRNPGLKEAVRARDGDQCRFCSVAVRWGKGRAADSGAWELLDPDGRVEAANIAVSCMRCAAGRRIRHGSSSRRHGCSSENAGQNRDESVSGTVTGIDGFDHQGLSIGVGKSGSELQNPRSQTKTRASEARGNRDSRDGRKRDRKRDETRNRDGSRPVPFSEADAIEAITKEFLKSRGRVVSPDESRHAKKVIDERADEHGTEIGSLRYYCTSVREEADMANLLPPEPAPEVPPQEAMTPQEAAKALGYNPDEFHEFDLDINTGVCREPWCSNPRGNWRHNPDALVARIARTAS